MELMVKSVMNIMQQYDQPLLEYFRDLSKKTCTSRKLGEKFNRLDYFNRLVFHTLFIMIATPGIEEITFQTAFK